jgi:hypothetical protein
MSYLEGIDDKLSACPFCGGKAAARYVGNDHTKKRSIMVRCTVCRITRTDSMLKHEWDWLENIAIEGWNKRSEPTGITGYW